MTLLSWALLTGREAELAGAQGRDQDELLHARSVGSLLKGGTGGTEQGGWPLGDLGLREGESSGLARRESAKTRTLKGVP